jgi:co-chaperonin GroES (HSP10)
MPRELIEHASHGRSAELSFKDRTEFPEGTKLRMLRDQMLVEPKDQAYSAIIYCINNDKPMRGIVRAIGPGHYPKKYNGPKGKRIKSWDSKHFQPTEVKVGDIVELGGLQYGGYSFQTVYIGNVLHLICREADVAGIVEEEL